jgi:hypothetical protein
MARIQVEFVLPIVDFISAAQTVRVNRETTPLELGLEWLVSFEKGHFNGRHAPLIEKERGSRRRLMAVEIGGKNPAHGSLIYDRPKGVRQIGEIKSALWSLTCERNIALAMIDAPYFKSLQEFWVDIYLHRELSWERGMERAWPVGRPFYAPEGRKAQGHAGAGSLDWKPGAKSPRRPGARPFSHELRQQLLGWGCLGRGSGADSFINYLWVPSTFRQNLYLVGVTGLRL